MPRPKIDHLERRGLRVVPAFLKDSEGKDRKDLAVVGRRSRKEWPCAADSKCSVGRDIDWDEVYVEVTEGICRYKGEVTRYHMPCALSLKVIERVADAADRGNQRRQAILMKRARLQNAREANE